MIHVLIGAGILFVGVLLGMFVTAVAVANGKKSDEERTRS